MNSLQKLTELFSSFPGIGPRQAKRFTYFLLTKNSSFRKELIYEIEHLGKDIGICSSCQRYYSKKSPTHKMCNICLDENRNKKILMLVSRDVDLEAVERAGVFDGLYFILGGSVPVLEKNPEKYIRKTSLISNIKNKAEKDGLEEVIFALNANPEGDHTASYLKEVLSPLQEKHGFKISVLGRGLSTGTELEYSDVDTLEHALKNRE